MPTPHTNHPATQRRTLAEKLKRLRDMKAPPGEPPPSYEITARQITQTTGVSISGPYFWELVTGRTTNPKLHHLQALARFYHVPIAYLADDHTDHHQLESELQLLHTLKHNGTHTIELQATDGESADLATVQRLLGKVRLLDDFGDEETREAAIRLSALEPAHRPQLLDALENERVRELTLTANALDDDRRATAAHTLGQRDLLDALADDDIQRAAVSLSQLTPASRQAVLALIDHLRQVEGTGES
ncbi:hypothetical protein [Streptomyces johnsoniae]|uniref:HTH cro/C1-type domain-containing protein n=1 Tax=Streptomyces johnsoniae TaxID=3075532 RepID=A0ABU2SCX5_9ACTN|nr:hypothetical protein [Streptomyces sp. DSM 41886]MDT0446828.1 hypothetical protein [Streptomyces sp. DSM 41886]